jgi:hypothetical protein
MSNLLLGTDESITESGAEFSPCRTWRYALWRHWDWQGHANCVMFVGMNPSTADELVNDKTISNCIGFAKRWGFGGIYMLNLFAFWPHQFTLERLVGAGHPPYPPSPIPPDSILDTRTKCLKCKVRYVLPELKLLCGDLCWGCAFGQPITAACEGNANGAASTVERKRGRARASGATGRRRAVHSRRR